MRIHIRLLFIFVFYSFTLISCQKIDIPNILRKLSIEHIDTKIENVPGSCNSVMISVMSHANNKERFIFLRKEILQNTVNICKENTKIFEEKLALPARRGLPNLTQKISEHTNKQIEDIIDYMSNTQYPELCLLRECWCIKRYNDFDESRFIENDRGNFERMLANRYLQYQYSNPYITYTSFASGGLFADLRILTLLLAQKKDLENHISFTQDIFEMKQAVAMGAHCEKLLAQKLIQHKKSKNNHNIITEATIESIHFIDPDHQGTIRILQKNVNNSLKNIQLCQNETLGDVLRIVQIIQLAAFLSAISGKKIAVCLHDYAIAYAKSCIKNNTFRPTVITSVDHNADNTIHYCGCEISYTHVEFMLLLMQIATDMTWLGDLNWKNMAKVQPLFNVEILVKNPLETKEYIAEHKPCIQFQKRMIQKYQTIHGGNYLTM